jgi:hypothetical protein
MLIMLIIPNLLIIGGIEFSKLPKTTKILVLLLLFLTIKNLEENFKILVSTLQKLSILLHSLEREIKIT